MKRSETKSAIALPKASENDGSREPRVNLDMSFQRSEFHFTNSVGIHPERDVASMRVIEQAEQMNKLAHKRKPASIMKKSYYPMEPQIGFSANVTPSKRRRIEINDDVEIYYYPENKE